MSAPPSLEHDGDTKPHAPSTAVFASDLELRAAAMDTHVHPHCLLPAPNPRAADREQEESSLDWLMWHVVVAILCTCWNVMYVSFAISLNVQKIS
jgi:hypothetical protein